MPKSDFEDELRNALVKSKYEFMNIYSYNVKPDKLTSQIKQITAYNERKEKLEKIIEFVEKGIKILEKEEELKNLKKKYTLGNVDLNSVVVSEKELKNLKKKYTLLDAQINDKELKNLKKKHAISLDNQINEEELKNLKKKYTLGEVDFDSAIIANFGENLKSVTNSFLFSDVTAQDVKFITLNQWFDETLLKESSANQILMKNWPNNNSNTFAFQLSSSK